MGTSVTGPPAQGEERGFSPGPDAAPLSRRRSGIPVVEGEGEHVPGREHEPRPRSE